MPIDTAQLAQMLYGDPAPQGEAGTGAPMQNEFTPTAAPDPILAEVGSMVAQPAGNFRPQTVEYDAFGNTRPAPLSLPEGTSKREVVTKTSDSGYSADKMREIEAGPMGSKQMAKGRAGIEQGVRKSFEDEWRALNSAYNAQASATTAFGAAESARIEAEAGHMVKVSALQQQHADGMKALAVDSALAAQKAKDEYRARLVAIPELNPNALWDEAGKSGQFQMATAAVIHNMLGVKGIKTTAMDTINQAIKNKIDAQIYNINSKKEVAAGFKDLYEMTVRESATQMEVQTKLHGYYLKAMETGIKAEMGKYDSAVHRAKAQLALTEVRKAQAQNLFEVEKHIQNATHAVAQEQIAIRGQNMSAATARADRESREKIAADELKRKQDAEKQSPFYVFDTNNKGRWAIRPEYMKNEKIVQQVQDKSAAFGGALATIEKMRELERKMKPTFDPITKTRFAPEDQRRYEAMAEDLARQIISARGETRPSDMDVIGQLKSLPSNTTFTRGGVSKILADTQLSLIEQQDQQLRPYVLDVPEGEQPSGPQNRASEGSRIDAEATIADPEAPARTERLVKVAQSPDALKPMDTKDLSKKVEFTTFTKPYWEDFIKQRPDMSGARMEKTGSRDDGNTYKQVGGSGPPVAFDALRELAEEAYHGGAHGAQARKDLEAFTQVDHETAGKNSIELQVMAKYFLDKLDNAKSPLGIKTESDLADEAPAEPLPPVGGAQPTIRHRR
jgi:hypothetical protein